MSEDRYKIMRFYHHRRPRTIATGLTLEEVQKHCTNPESSYDTATRYDATSRTRRLGPWFDGYTKDKD